MAGTEYGGPYVLIDKQGNELTDKLSSGLRMIKMDEHLGFADMEGNIVIRQVFDYAEPFRDGLAIVAFQGERSGYGIIDTRGNFVLEPEYCIIQRARNGSFIVGERQDGNGPLPPAYVDYCLKALFSKDLKNHTDWVFQDVESFDGKYTCVTDGNSIYYLDAYLNEAEDLPRFSGRGIMLSDGALLRGTINGCTTVAERSGRILMKDEKLTLFGGRFRSRSVTWYPYKNASITYPVIEGMSDKQIQDELNRIIEKKAKSYWGFDVTDAEEPYLLPVLEANGTAQVTGNLLHLEFWVDEYSYGVHGGHVWDNIYINIRNGKAYTIDDLFKSPYEARRRLAEKVTEAIWEDRDAYLEDHVEPEQINSFKINNDGLIIYFGEYEIAPYAAGMPSFNIPFSEIMDLIDTEGDFWKSFH